VLTITYGLLLRSTTLTLVMHSRGWGGQPFRYLWSVTDGFQLIKIELKCRLVF